MADFLMRLAQRTLGVGPVAQPIIAPIFAPVPTMPNLPFRSEAPAIADIHDAAPMQHSQHAEKNPIQQFVPHVSPSTQLTANHAQTEHHSENQNARLPHTASEYKDHVAIEQPRKITIENGISAINMSDHQQNTSSIDKHNADRAMVKEPFIGSQEKFVSMKRTTTQPGTPIDEMMTEESLGIVIHEPKGNTPLVRRSQPVLKEVAEEGSAEKMVSFIALPSSITGGAIVQHGQPGQLGRILQEETSADDVMHQETQTTQRRGVPHFMMSNRLHSQAQLLGPDVSAIEQHNMPVVKDRNLLPEHQPLLVPTMQLQVQQETSSQQYTVNPLHPAKGGERWSQATPLQVAKEQSVTGQRLEGPLAAQRSVEARPSIPTIQITIGRIDVRAVTPSSPAPRQQPSKARPSLSLDDYARQNKREGR